MLIILTNFCNSNFVYSDDCIGKISSNYTRSNHILMEKLSFGPVKWISPTPYGGIDKLRHTILVYNHNFERSIIIP